MTMRKGRFDNMLRAGCTRSARRSGFSLTELIVAIGILVLMFSLAGQVFNVTVQSTGQARAITNLSQMLRAVEDTIREDLRHVQAGRSLILIQGNPVNAYWTGEGRAADEDGDPSNGYPHVADPARELEEPDEFGRPRMIKPRADILMFFTARKGASYTDPGVTSNLQQVVYGHAELGEYVPDDGATPYVFQPGLDAFPAAPTSSPNLRYPSSTLVSQVPAAGWHLARRGVVLTSSPMPGVGVHPRNMTLEEYVLLLQGVVDVNGWFSFDEWVMPGVGAQAPWYLPSIFPTSAQLQGGVPVPHQRSMLDLTPPARLADRLGHYFLSNCASFKVEWTLDPRSEFVAGRLDRAREVYWFDPGDPDDPLEALETGRTAADEAGDDALYADLTSLLTEATPHPDGMFDYSLADRFRGWTLMGEQDPAWNEVAYELYGVRRPNTVVFGAARLKPPDVFGEKPEVVSEDIFPGALRITIDVYDDERRLERPVRHVIVAPVGQ
jgi:prepilin-type N-terminal cleavage/methylation domain-containing protein